MRALQLSQNKVAWVDDEDYPKVKDSKWFYNNGYAMSKSTGERVLLHRFLTNCPKGMQVDHKDGDPLNNRRDNIRICTLAENNRNKKKGKGTSKYKGVAWDKWTNKWLAHIKNIHIGRFDEEIEAAEAYDLKAKEVFGEYARPNFS
jgi:hypothetical protein